MLQTNVPAPVPAQFNSPYVLKAKTLLWAQMLRIKNLPAELEHGAYPGGDMIFKAQCSYRSVLFLQHL
jgi:hypothetical protein